MQKGLLISLYTSSNGAVKIIFVLSHKNAKNCNLDWGYCSKWTNLTFSLCLYTRAVLNTAESLMVEQCWMNSTMTRSSMSMQLVHACKGFDWNGLKWPELKINHVVDVVNKIVNISRAKALNNERFGAHRGLWDWTYWCRKQVAWPGQTAKKSMGPHTHTI